MDNALMPLRLEIQGWRGISHSYALVNQFQWLAWHRLNLGPIQHVDVPFEYPHWQQGGVEAGLSKEDLSVLGSGHVAFEPEASYRIFSPLVVPPTLSLPTLTFAVTEIGLESVILKVNDFTGYAHAGGAFHTPSHWSKARLVEAGIDEASIAVIPHGVDKRYFYPLSDAQIKQQRLALGFSEEDVVLLNVGTPVFAKGIDILLKGFVNARQAKPNLRLMLKDQVSMYQSSARQTVLPYLKSIGNLREDDVSAIRMIEQNLSLEQLNMLYNMADVYVAPYRAEGFNLPAFEALSVGTPVIVTKGGASDDYLGSNWPGQISATLQRDSQTLRDAETVYLEPDLDHLSALLKASHRKSPVQPGADRSNAILHQGPLGPVGPAVTRTWEQVALELHDRLRALC